MEKCLSREYSGIGVPAVSRRKTGGIWPHPIDAGKATTSFGSKSATTGQPPVEPTHHSDAVAIGIALLLPSLAILAYYTTAALPVLAGILFTCAFFAPARKADLRPLDWAILALLLYEIPSLALSRYPASGMTFARILSTAVAFYFTLRLAPAKPLLSSVTAAAGGFALACQALARFDAQFHALEAVGFSDIIAFRSHLIALGTRWVQGEWFTLVLTTLPIAAAVPVALWAARRHKWALAAASAPVLIAAALLLSCSRAIFWSVPVFAAAAVALAAAYRIFRPTAAAALLAVLLAAAGAILLIENAIYPGIAGAYFARQASQTRSTEGRFAIWKRSAGIFQLAPLTGLGTGNAPWYLASDSEPETTGFASRTFSLPVQLLVEKGAIGALLYLAALALAAWEAHRKLRHPKLPLQSKALACCLAAGAVAVLFRELTYSSLFEHEPTAMLFAMSLALLATPETQEAA